MKKVIVMTMILLTVCLAHAQIGVGPIEQVKMKSGKFTKEDLSRLKTSKTVFVYRESDDLEALQKAIKEVWTVTEISFVPFSEMKKIDLKNTSVFSIAGLNTNVTNLSSGMNYDNTHIYLSLWMQGKNKKGKKVKNSYCRIELHPSFTDYSMVTGSRRKDGLNYIYKEGTLKNWTVGFLKNYLKNVNDLLLEGEERWLYESDNKNKEIKGLKGKTLYVVDYGMVKFNKFSGDESKRQKEEKLFKSYPHKYQMISGEELSKKILESEKAFYYLVYVKSSTDKYIYVFNSKTAAVVYSKYKGTSYNLKDSDLKDLAKAIKK